MKIDTKPFEPLAVMTSVDEASVNAFVAEVQERLKSRPESIRLDCASLVSPSSANVRTLWLARQLCEQHGSHVELHNVPSGLRRVLQILDLAELFSVEPQDSYRLSIAFAPTEDDINSTMSTLVAFLTGHGVPDAPAFDLQTVFYEVTTNIRRHGQLADNDSVAFKTKISGQTVELTIIDTGMEFDPTVGMGTDLDVEQAGRDHRRGGFGLAMIDRLSNSVTYVRAEQSKNVLGIVKSW